MAIGCRWALLCLLFLDCHCSDGLSYSSRLSQSCTTEQQTGIAPALFRAGEDPAAVSFSYSVW